MKIIKTFLLLTIALNATTLLHAQNLKPELVKETDVKLPPPATADKKTLPAPELKPMNGIVPKEAPAAAAQTTPALKNDENKNQPEQPKLQVISIDANAANSKLTVEQLNTLNGIAEKPKQTAAPASTPRQTPRPAERAARLARAARSALRARASCSARPGRLRSVARWRAFVNGKAYSASLKPRSLARSSALLPPRFATRRKPAG